MGFYIQTCNPMYLIPQKEIVEQTIVEEISYAIQLVFPMVTERALLVWEDIYIPICYKYDLSVMMEDILFMLSELQEKNQGTCQIGFGSDTFNALWEMEWVNEKLSINAKWDYVRGNLAVVNSSCNKLIIDVSTFLCEWKGILTHVIEAIKRSNINMDNCNEYDSLLKINTTIPKFGRLYQNTNS